MEVNGWKLEPVGRGHAERPGKIRKLDPVRDGSGQQWRQAPNLMAHSDPALQPDAQLLPISLRALSHRNARFLVIEGHGVRGGKTRYNVR